MLSLPPGLITALWTDLSFSVQRRDTWNAEPFLCYFPSRPSGAFFVPAPGTMLQIKVPQTVWRKQPCIMFTGSGVRVWAGRSEEGLSLCHQCLGLGGKTWRLGRTGWRLTGSVWWRMPADGGTAACGLPKRS